MNYIHFPHRSGAHPLLLVFFSASSPKACHNHIMPTPSTPNKDSTYATLYINNSIENFNFFLLFKYILDFLIFYLIKIFKLLIYYTQKLFKKYYVKSNNHLGLELVNRQSIWVMDQNEFG